MKSLVTFINESINKSDIKNNVKEVNDLTSMLSSIGIKKTRITKWNKCVKKVLGTNKSLYVLSTYGDDKSNIEAFHNLIDNGQIRRGGVHNGKTGSDLYEITRIDVAKSNADHHELFDPKKWPEKDPKELIDMFKANMKYDLSNNAYIKKVGITDDVRKQVDDICTKFNKEINDAQHEGDSFFIYDDEGDRTIMYPSLFVVGTKVIKSICIGSNDNVYSKERFTKKVAGDKCMIIFSKEDIDNLKDEAE